MEALPSELSKCSGMDLDPENADHPNPLSLWNFLNGREMLISSNKQGGYELSIDY